MPGYDVALAPPARVLRLNKKPDRPKKTFTGRLNAEIVPDLPLQSQSLLAQLDGYWSSRSYRRREYVYLPFENPEKLYVVRRGFVEIGVLSRDGRELTLDVLGEGESFGAVLLPGGKGEFARAIGPAVVEDLQREDLDLLLRKEPGITIGLLKAVQSRHREMAEKFQQMVFLDVRSRIASMLLGLYGKCGDGRGLIPISLTHQDIANSVASSRETASLHLSELKKLGILHYNRRHIRILSLPELAALIRPIA